MADEHYFFGTPDLNEPMLKYMWSSCSFPGFVLLISYCVVQIMKRLSLNRILSYVLPCFLTVCKTASLGTFGVRIRLLVEKKDF